MMWDEGLSCVASPKFLLCACTVRCKGGGGVGWGGNAAALGFCRFGALHCFRKQSDADAVVSHYKIRVAQLPKGRIQI